MGLARCRLLAIDLDGTLLRDDGSIAATDRTAIARARQLGIVVTLATGRLPASTLPTARTLDLDAPLVCADGAVIIDARDGAVVRSTPLSARACARILEVSAATALAPFFLTPSSLLTRPAHRNLATSLRGFTENVGTFEGLGADTTRQAGGGEPFIAGLLVGPAEAVQRTADEMRAEELRQTVPDIEHETFAVGESRLWAIRVRSAMTTKASGLDGICADLGIAASEAAAVGDWYNDVSMLAWAGHSFAMAGSPPAVAARARTRLLARTGQGGGIAETVASLLAPAS